MSDALAPLRHGDRIETERNGRPVSAEVRAVQSVGNEIHRLIVVIGTGAQSILVAPAEDRRGWEVIAWLDEDATHPDTTPDLETAAALAQRVMAGKPLYGSATRPLRQLAAAFLHVFPGR